MSNTIHIYILWMAKLDWYQINWCLEIYKLLSIYHQLVSQFKIDPWMCMHVMNKQGNHFKSLIQYQTQFCKKSDSLQYNILNKYYQTQWLDSLKRITKH